MFGGDKTLQSPRPEGGHRRLPLLCLGTTAYAEVFADTHEDNRIYEFMGFVENLDSSRTGATILDLPIYWSDSIDDLKETHSIVCALGTTLRRNWIEGLLARGFRLASLIHPSASVSRRASLSAGTVVDPGTVIAARTNAGPCVRIGRLSAIGHHIDIGAYSTIHPSVTISSGCRIGEQVVIGTGAVLANDIVVGDGAVIAAGSVVTTSVPAGALVRGNPARIVREGFGPR